MYAVALMGVSFAGGSEGSLAGRHYRALIA
jgi:hypothetical protein